MQPKDPKEEISILEIQLAEYEKILDSSISANEEFAKTRDIFREIKKVRERLEDLKRISNSGNHHN
jgi:hypothetical protein